MEPKRGSGGIFNFLHLRGVDLSWRTHVSLTFLIYFKVGYIRLGNDRI